MKPHAKIIPCNYFKRTTVYGLAYETTALHKPCKRFASVAQVCQRQLAFLVKNSFTGTICRKYAIKILLLMPPHLKCVTTLPCEILMSKNLSDLYTGALFLNLPETWHTTVVTGASYNNRFWFQGGVISNWCSQILTHRQAPSANDSTSFFFTVSRGISQTGPWNLAKFSAENCGPYSFDVCSWHASVVNLLTTSLRSPGSVVRGDWARVVLLCCILICLLCLICI